MSGYTGVLDYYGNAGAPPLSRLVSDSSSGKRSIGNQSAGNRSAASATSSLGGNSFSMFPNIEKKYKVKITKEIERELRFLGQSRSDALISELDMTLLKDSKGIQTYELVEQGFYTMKSVITIRKSHVFDVMSLMEMPSTTSFRDTMGDIFGSLFLDGVVLYNRPKDPSHPHESLSVNWMALQSSKPHLPHRDYIFLKYGDVFHRSTDQLLSRTMETSSDQCVGVSVWESIEIDGCGPLPELQNVARLTLRRSGFVFEESQTLDSMRVSFFLSESHSGRPNVSALTKSWLNKMLLCVSEIASALMAKHLSELTFIGPRDFKDGPCCFICMTKFTMLKRRHHCRICGDVVCSKCSQVKNVRQKGVSSDTRICLQCTNTYASARKSHNNSNSNTSAISSRTQTSNSYGNGKHVRHAAHSSHSLSSAASMSSGRTSSYNDNDSSCSYYEKDPTAGVLSPVMQHSVIPENEDFHGLAMNPHPHPPHPPHPDGKTKLRVESTSSTSSSSDMILLSEFSALAQPPQRQHKAPLGGVSIRMQQRRVDDKVDDEEPSHETFPQPHHGGEPGRAVAPNTVLLSSPSTENMKPANITANTPFSYALSYSSRQEWPKAPIPRNEAARLLKVRSLHLTDPDRQFQDMVDVAATTLSCSIAAICIIGDKTAFLLAKLGLAKQEIQRNVLFDAHTILSATPTVVLNAKNDVRFVNNPLATNGNIQFYAGVPLVTSDGHFVGSFSVADSIPRKEVTGDQLYFLQNLANLVIRGIETNTARNEPKHENMQIHGGGTNTSRTREREGEKSLKEYKPPPMENMDLVQAQQTMKNLLETAYHTQNQVRMQVHQVE